MRIRFDPLDLKWSLYRRSVEDGTGELCDTDLAFILATLGLRRSVANVFQLNAHGIQRTEARRLVTDPYTLTTDRGAEPELLVRSRFSGSRTHLAPGTSRLLDRGFACRFRLTLRIVRRSNAYRRFMAGGSATGNNEWESMAAPILAKAATGTVAGNRVGE